MLKNFDDKRKFLFEDLSCFDEKETAGALSVEEKAMKNVVAADLEKITLMEEIFWRQKS